MRLVELVKRYRRVFVPSRVWQKASERYRGEGAKATVVQLSPDYPSSPGLIEKAGGARWLVRQTHLRVCAVWSVADGIFLANTDGRGGGARFQRPTLIPESNEEGGC